MILIISLVITLSGIDPKSDSCSIYEMTDASEAYEIIAYIDQPEVEETHDIEVVHDGRVIYLSADCENGKVSETVYAEYQTLNWVEWYRRVWWWVWYQNYLKGEG